MKFFLVALASTLAAGEDSPSFSSLRRTAVVQGDDRENAFVKLYYDELTQKTASHQKNGEVPVSYTHLTLPTKA